MSLHFTEGYDDRLTALKSPGFTGTLQTTPITGMNGDHMRIEDRQDITLTDDEAVVGFRMRPAENNSPGFLQMYYDAFAQAHIRYHVDSVTRAIFVVRSDDASTLGISAIGLWPAGVIRHFETHFKVHATTGFIKVWLDGILVIDVSGLDTRGSGGSASATFDVISIMSGASATHPIFDDVYVLTVDGTAPNAPLGSLPIVHNSLPTGNGATSGLTGSDANQTDNFLLVDEVTPDSADYNGAATQGLLDTYAMANLPSTSLTVHALRNHMYAHKSDAGAKFMRPVLRSGGTDFTGVSVSLSQTPGLYSESFNVDPNTTAAWTGTNVNALEVGAEVRDS